jgi:type II secretory pathway component PulF
MMNTAKLITSFPIPVFILTVLPPVLLAWYLNTPGGRSKYQRWAIKTPIISGFIQDLETTRVFRTLEVLVNNGVHLAQALKIASGVAGNEAYRNLLGQATKALKEGRSIGQQLATENLFPVLATDLLSIGEESGRVGEMCGQIADHFEKGLKERIKHLTAMVEPIFILIIALVAGYVVISMLSVILSINDIV